MDISMITLLAIVVVVVLVVAALRQSPLGGHGLFWCFAVGLIILSVAFVAKLNSYNAMQQRNLAEQQRVEFEVNAADDIAHISANRYAVPGTTMYVGQFDKAMPAQPMPAVRGWIVVLCLFAIPLLAFLGIRRYRSNVGAGGFRGLAAAGVALLAFLIVGIFFIRSGAVHVATSPDAPTWTAYPPLTSLGPASNGSHRFQGVIPQDAVNAEEPLDELWDRLNAPRIELSAATSSEGEASAAEHETVPSESNSDSSSADDAENPVDADGEPVQETRVVESPATDAVNVTIAAPQSTSSQPRPDWVGQPPRFVGNVRRVVVQAGPYSTLGECYEDLRNQMGNAVTQHLFDLVSESTGDANAYIPPLEQMGITNTLITRDILTDQYVEEGEASFGLTRTAWGLLEFSEGSNRNLLNAWKRDARRGRIAGTAALAGCVISVVGGIFALLKIDTWTRGYYTKRLFLGVPAAIIGLIVLFAMATA